MLFGLREGIDRATLVRVSDALDGSALSWTLLFTLVFITLGRIAAGVLLWRAEVGPATRWRCCSR